MQPKSKHFLRQICRENRRQIPAEQRVIAAQRAAAIFSKLTIFQQSEHIACYLSCHDELDSYPLIELIWQQKKFCYLPLVRDAHERDLDFCRYQLGDALEKNCYGISEPVNKIILIEPQYLDLVIMPLIAFDRHGYRLGSGGGYYDHTFAFLKPHYKQKPYLLGFAYAKQEVDTVPHDPWDVRLQSVLTEDEFIVCG